MTLRATGLADAACHVMTRHSVGKFRDPSAYYIHRPSLPAYRRKGAIFSRLLIDFPGLTRAITCFTTECRSFYNFRRDNCQRSFRKHVESTSLGGGISHVLVVSCHRGPICVVKMMDYHVTNIQRAYKDVFTLTSLDFKKKKKKKKR